jgi:hypothetical protein
MRLFASLAPSLGIRLLVAKQKQREECAKHRQTGAGAQ